MFDELVIKYLFSDIDGKSYALMLRYGKDAIVCKLMPISKSPDKINFL